VQIAQQQTKNYFVAIERMKHLRCYQMLIVCKDKNDEGDIKIKLKSGKNTNKNKNIFHLKSGSSSVLSVTFPSCCSIKSEVREPLNIIKLIL